MDPLDKLFANFDVLDSWDQSRWSAEAADLGDDDSDDDE